LERAGLESLEDVAAIPRAELAAMHGMGPKALRTLDEALAAEGLAREKGVELGRNLPA
jgi:DNA-directed RNA polymerase alpha subunit